MTELTIAAQAEVALINEKAVDLAALLYGLAENHPEASKLCSECYDILLNHIYDFLW